MINLAIEIIDKNIVGVDLTHPEYGNPGIGGSEWLFLLLAREINKNYGTVYRVTVYHNSDNRLPEGLLSKKFDNNDNLIDLLQENQEQVFIHQIAREPIWYSKIDQIDIIDIPWAHCYIKYPEIQAINGCNNVKRVVFVGKEEYDSYIDDDIIKKATFIYNMIPPIDKMTGRDIIGNRNVLYMGSLVEGKAFHYLAEIWKDILKRVPDAQLYIAGTGKLYDRNVKLGNYDIAEEAYEDKFIVHLIESNGELLESVHFLGLIDNEKDSIFATVSVGVVNPLGKDETFCLSAVEMEQFGIPIVTISKYGLLDTVKHKKTGLLFRNKKGFINNICTLLEDKGYNNYLGENAKKFVKQFYVSNILPEWNRLFMEVVSGIECGYMRPSENFLNDYKWLKILIRYFRFNLHFTFLKSFSELKYKVKSIIKRRNI